MNEEYLKQCIALTLISGVGNVYAKSLVSTCGSVEAVFKEKKKNLVKITGIGSNIADNILRQDYFSKAEEEVEYARKNNINILFYLDENYPRRLLNCSDNPLLLYFKGNADLNTSKIISIVGTRNSTEYGKKCCETLVEDLAKNDILVVSGLAYGIDICAHKVSLKNNLATVGVVGHGMDMIYPSVHKNTAREMLDNGGILTEFHHDAIPDRENFPKRNRIIAGMADATVVVEAGAKGGALITADIANSYNRDVFAFPGNIHEPYSIGCNKLIKANKAALIESYKDLEYIMGWEINHKKKESVQKSLFIDLSDEEQIIVDILKENKNLHVDLLAFNTNFPISKLSSNILSLELKGVIRSLPGKIYELT